MSVLDIDPYSLGDPAGMRALATTLAREASEVAARGDALLKTLDDTTFEGPAATRFRSSVRNEIAEARRVAADLQDLANYITRAAARVESDIAELLRAQEEVRRQQLEAG